jgi:hypothetical protein
MRIERLIYSVLILACAGFAALNWRKATLFQADNDQLRSKVEELQTEAVQANEGFNMVKANLDKQRGQMSELQKLRGEVTLLRGSSNALAALRVENQRLAAENSTLRAQGSQAQNAPAGQGLAGRNQFPRDSWAFAGYSSPEAALVSALWAMKQGDPKIYLDSLAPDEQQRTAQSWQNKSEADIAQKHQSDVSSIASLRVLDRQSISPNEMVMDVYLEGPGRVEKIRMNQIGQDWKFGGFIRNPAPAQQQIQPPQQ